MQDKAPGRGAVAQDKGRVLSAFGSCLPQPTLPPKTLLTGPSYCVMLCFLQGRH